VKLRKPWMIKAVAGVGTGILKLWLSTVRTRADSRGQQTDPSDPTLQERYIYALWHEGLFLIPTFRSQAPVTVLASQSADGELLARVCRSYGVATVRGSSTRGGMDAVDELLGLGKRSHLIVAPDGPKGPRREVKRGLVYLAAWTGMRVVPLGVGFQRAWRAKSWDRTALPRPWSSITCVAGPIVQVPAGLGKVGMEEHRRLIEQALHSATTAAEAWARGEKPTLDWPDVAQSAA